jgi:hypothetical protein
MSLEICSSHFNEDLEWLKKSPWPVSIVHHEGGAPVDYTYLIPNVGLEASAYFKYILERYDSLPDHVAFIHGHETSWHHQGDRPLLDMIKTANFEKYDYIPLNNCWRCVNSSKQMVDQLECLENNKFTVEPIFITCCGGQFIVSKKAILANTKKQYEDWCASLKHANDAICFELIWHTIFGCGSSIVPLVDHFVPRLSEVLYAPSSDIPMLLCKFKPCLLGGHIREGFINVTNKAEYEYYSIRGGTFFADEHSRIDFKIDTNKLNAPKYLQGMRMVIACFNALVDKVCPGDTLHI